MLLAANAHKAERAAVEQRYKFDQATSQFGAEIYKLTSHARQLVVSGDPTHLIVYRQERKALATVEDRIDRISDNGTTEQELSALVEAVRWADLLHDEQEAAIAAWERGDEATARTIMFGAEYERELGRVSNSLDRFQYQLDERIASEVASATNLSNIWRRISEAVLAITALLFLCVLYFVIKRRILKPVVRLSDVVTKLAAQNYSVESPGFEHVDEIGDMAQAIGIFRENGLERQRLELLRDQEMHFQSLMERFGRRMQSCVSVEELGETARHFIPELTGGGPGRLYTRTNPGGSLVELCHWLSPAFSTLQFAPHECWALRRSALHRPRGEAIDIPCGHLGDDTDESLDTICVPLTAQQQPIGLLYLERRRTGDDEDRFPSDLQLKILAENIGLAIANLELRKALNDMAMFDPLTGLANRRQLALSLEEFEEADTQLSCLVLDIDHFKQFNDRFGHEAGDQVLEQVGALLAGATRDKALAFRFGGEEFVVLIPDIGHEKAGERAEQIRAEVAALDLYHEGRSLGSISMSIGVASAPQQCSWSRIISLADSALLAAKEAGRNRVVVISDSTKSAVA